MSQTMPWYPLYHEDFQLDTGSWTCAEIGALMRLMNHQWANGSVPNDHSRLARICCVSEREFKRIWSTLRPKFETLSRGKLVNRRLAVEYERQTKKREQATAAAQTRWGKGSKISESDADALQTDMRMASDPDPEPDTRDKNKREASPPLPPGLNVAAWEDWLAYRRESRWKKWVPRTVKARTEMLAEYTYDEQSTIIDHSINNGYKGLFPDSALGGSNGRRERLGPAERIEKATGVKRL